MSVRADEIMAESFRIIDAAVGNHSFRSRNGRSSAASFTLPATWNSRIRSIFTPMPRSPAFGAFSGGNSDRRRCQHGRGGDPEATGSRLNQDPLFSQRQPDIVAKAEERGTTRSAYAMEQAIAVYPEAVYVIGNAPDGFERFVLGSAKGRHAVRD